MKNGNINGQSKIAREKNLFGFASMSETSYCTVICIQNVSNTNPKKLIEQHFFFYFAAHAPQAGDSKFADFFELDSSK